MPLDFQIFRATLSRKLNLPEHHLPFVTEMVEVKPDEARCIHPGLAPLLMTNAVFDRYAGRYAVHEPTPASNTIPKGLTEEESTLYLKLLNLKKNRLKQEFLPEALVSRAIKEWQGKEKIISALKGQQRYVAPENS